MPKHKRISTAERKYTRRIIAVRGDIQSGHAGGLLNPETQYPVVKIDEDKKRTIEGYEDAHLRPVQQTFWKWHESAMEGIRKLAGADPITFLEMGDVTQGVRFLDDLAETNLSRQQIAAYYNTKPWAEIAEAVYIVKGTGVHVWGEGSSETILTALLRKEYPNKPIKTADHWMLDVGGFLMDISHHGPGPGKRTWLKGNEFRWYLQSLLMADLERNNPIPAVVLRGHNHDYTRTSADHQVSDKYWRVEGILTPPFCFIGAHANQAMLSPSGMGVGMLALEVVNGKLVEVWPFMHYIDLRTLEVVK